MFVLMPIQSGRLHGVDIGQVFRDVLYDMRISLKEAALTMGYRESSQLCRALNGEKGYAIDEWRVAELGAEFASRFYAKVLAGLRSPRMLKAQLRADERKVAV